MKTFVYFIRHAISPFSLNNERDRVLSEQGKAEADLVVEML
jgi:2,3-bisphosphoglycerate-dependent phosphoglycerate mutase